MKKYNKDIKTKRTLPVTWRYSSQYNCKMNYEFSAFSDKGFPTIHMQRTSSGLSSGIQAKKGVLMLK
jgi:hypothetical protein